MLLKKRPSRRNQLIIMTTLGILIIIISRLFVRIFNLDWKDWTDQVILNIGIIFLTVVVVSIIWNLLGGEPQEKLLENLNNSVRLLGKSKNTGLIDITEVSGSYATHSAWMNMLAAADYEIDLMGYSLRSWRYGPNFCDVLVGLARKGVKIRIMIMHENSANLEAINNPKILPAGLGSLKTEIMEFQHIYENKLTESNLQFSKVSKGLITSQICRIDSNIYVTPYLYSIQTSESPLYVVEGENTELYKKYKNEFDTLWDSNFTNPT